MALNSLLQSCPASGSLTLPVLPAEEKSHRKGHRFSTLGLLFFLAQAMALSAATSAFNPAHADGDTATGIGAVASGGNSTATGFNSRATGSNSSATGAVSLASGNQSTATGVGAVANNEGSTATGQGSLATGYSSTANGQGSEGSGYYSTATGAYTSAGGFTSTATGALTRASGNSSTATGGFGVASGDFSTATGIISAASGYLSTATGARSIASGYGSTATGAGSLASGFLATAIGIGSAATGDKSIALGSTATAGYANSVAIGAGSVAERANQVILASRGQGLNTVYTLPGLATGGAFSGDANQVTSERQTRFTTVDNQGNLGTTSFAVGDVLNRFDGINGRLNNIESALDKVNNQIKNAGALAVALTAIPNLTTDQQRYGCGLGVGGYGSGWAGAAGCAAKIGSKYWINGALAVSNSVDSGFASTPSVAGRVGVFYQWGAPTAR